MRKKGRGRGEEGGELGGVRLEERGKGEWERGRVEVRRGERGKGKGERGRGEYSKRWGVVARSFGYHNDNLYGSITFVIPDRILA